MTEIRKSTIFTHVIMNKHTHTPIPHAEQRERERGFHLNSNDFGCVYAGVSNVGII